MEGLATLMAWSGYMIYTINSGYGDWFDMTIGGLMIFTATASVTDITVTGNN